MAEGAGFNNNVVTYTPATGAITTKVINGSLALRLSARARYAPNADVEAYVSDAALYVWRYSTGTETTLATACPFTSTCQTAPVWNPNGLVVYVLRQGAIWEYPVAGGAGRSLYSAAGLSDIAVSPDGQFLAFIENESLRLLRLNVGSATPTTLIARDFRSYVFGGVLDEQLAWSPDSKSIAFTTYARSGGNAVLFVANLDGNGRVVRYIDTYSGISWGR